MQANFYDGSIIGQRDEQQDDRTNVILDDDYRLYVLADGMGGQQAGQLASKTVCGAFREFFRANPSISAPEDALLSALEFANQTVADLLTRDPDLVGMGTTAIAVLLHEPTRRFSFISVGDSPLYVFDGNNLRRINANHAFFEDLRKLIAAGEMTEEEAATHPDRHAITSAVMGKPIEKYDLQSSELAAHEVLVLASDGVQSLSDDAQGEIATVLKDSYPDLEAMVSQLLTAVEAKALSHQDNTTILIASAAPVEIPAPSTEVDLTPKTQAAPRTQRHQRNEEPDTHRKRGRWLFWLILLILILVAVWAVNPQYQAETALNLIDFFIAVDVS
ncbi:MAG: serine/threonine-protein phosphatase [Idiomarina sp.]|nr:serine/threonine-protein phosphatase [Idiomarina sp.]